MDTRQFDRTELEIAMEKDEMTEQQKTAKESAIDRLMVDRMDNAIKIGIAQFNVGLNKPETVNRIIVRINKAKRIERAPIAKSGKWYIRHANELLPIVGFAINPVSFPWGSGLEFFTDYDLFHSLSADWLQKFKPLIQSYAMEESAHIGSMGQAKFALWDSEKIDDNPVYFHDVLSTSVRLSKLLANARTAVHDKIPTVYHRFTEIDANQWKFSHGLYDLVDGDLCWNILHFVIEETREGFVTTYQIGDRRYPVQFGLAGDVDLPDCLADATKQIAYIVGLPWRLTDDGWTYAIDGDYEMLSSTDDLIGKIKTATMDENCLVAVKSQTRKGMFGSMVGLYEHKKAQNLEIGDWIDLTRIDMHPYTNFDVTLPSTWYGVITETIDVGDTLVKITFRIDRINPEIGSISSATLRTVDLLPVYVRTVAQFDPIWLLKQVHDDPELAQALAKFDDIDGLFTPCLSTFVLSDTERIELSEDGYHHWDSDIPEDEVMLLSWFMGEDLYDRLSEIQRTPYVYFGSHMGDGADIGYWADSEAVEDALRYNELVNHDDIDNDGCVDGEKYTGLSVSISDHGNMELYDHSGLGEPISIWGIV